MDRYWWNVVAVVAAMLIGREIDNREPADLLVHLERIVAREIVDANIIRLGLQLAREQLEAHRPDPPEDEPEPDPEPIPVRKAISSPVATSEMPALLPMPPLPERPATMAAAPTDQCLPALRALAICPINRPKEPRRAIAP